MVRRNTSNIKQMPGGGRTVAPVAAAAETRYDGLAAAPKRSAIARGGAARREWNAMAQFDISIDDAHQMTVIRAVGDILRARELLDFMVACDYGNRLPRTLWDLEQASWHKVSSDDLIAGVRDSLSFTKAGYRTAFVVGSDVDYGLGRMCEAYLERFGIKTALRVFRDRDSAVAWLSEAALG